MKKPETYRTGLQTPALGVSQGAHLLRIDDLLVLAAFLRTLSAFERVNLLPTGKVDRLDTARLQQSVDGLRITISGHTATLGSLRQIFQHVGHDQQRVGLGGTDQTNRTALRPTGRIQTLTHLNRSIRTISSSLSSNGDASVTVRVRQMPGAVAGL